MMWSWLLIDSVKLVVFGNFGIFKLELGWQLVIGVVHSYYGPTRNLGSGSVGIVARLRLTASR
jgi:hypothetical protein